MRKYVRLVLDIHPGQEWDDIPSRSKNIVHRVEQLYETGLGNNRPEVTGTWWAAYNGVSQYLTHERGRTADSRLDNLWFGNGRAVLDKALKTAVEMADLSASAA